VPLSVDTSKARALPWIAAFAVAAGAAALGFVLSNYRLHLLNGWIAYGVLALSLALVWGRAGIFSFGQPAFFGVGGYLYGIVAVNFAAATGETLTALVAGTVAGAVFAALVGYFMFYGRVGDVYVGIITLAVTLVLYTVMGATSASIYRVGDAYLGGYNGLRPIPKLMLPGGPEPNLRFHQTYWFMVAVAAALYMTSLWITKRPLGRIFLAIRENELRAELLGYDVRSYKLQAFTIGGALAGLAGGLFAVWAGVITPAVFSLAQMALVVIWVLVGGRTSLFGAFVGVILVQALANTFGGTGGVLSGQTPLLLGAIFILFVLLLPGGLVPSATLLWRRVAERRPRESSAAGSSSKRVPSRAEQPIGDSGNAATDRLGGSRLEVQDLSKVFGGVVAVDGVSVGLDGPGLYSIVGPNGAGKSTFFNLLVGRYAPTSGRILADGQDLGRIPLYRRAGIVGVKLQQPSVFPGLTVRENAWLAAYARSRDVVRADQDAHGLLDRLRLSGRANDLAGDLSHGEQQWLELSMVLARNPPIILLDEPTAGMTRGETLQVVPVVRQLAQLHIVIVVEHDMTFVEELKAPVVLLHQGKVFAEGSIEELRANEAVLDIYLGRS
jgi:branched-chain amino acid transport system permease protein